MATPSNATNMDTGYFRPSPQIILAQNISRQPSLTHDVEISFTVQFLFVPPDPLFPGMTLEISSDNVNWMTMGICNSVIFPSPFLTLKPYVAFNNIVPAGFWYRINTVGTVAPISLSPITELTL